MSRDFTQIARGVADKATGQPERVDEDADEQHARAVETGRAGGLKGGRARAERLSPEERSESARRAANARWERARRGNGFQVSQSSTDSRMALGRVVIQESPGA